MVAGRRGRPLQPAMHRRVRRRWARLRRALAVPLVAALMLLSACAHLVPHAQRLRTQQLEDAVLPLAATALQTGQLETARRLYGRLLEVNGDSVTAHMGLGDVAFQEGNPTAAARWYKSAAKRTEEPEARHLALLAHGRASLAAGRLGAARKSFAEVARAKKKASPASVAWARNGVGLTMLLEGDLTGAVAEMEGAVELAPEEERLQVNLDSARAALDDLPPAAGAAESSPSPFADPAPEAVAEETEPSGSEDRAPVLDPPPLAGAVAQSAGGAPTLGPDPTVLDSDGLGSGGGERPDRPSPVVQPSGVEAPTGGGEGELAAAAEQPEQPDGAQAGADIRAGWPDSVVDEAPSAGAVAEETEPSGSEDRAPVLDPPPLAGAVAQSAGGAPTLSPDPTVLDSDGLGSGDGERPDRPSPVAQPPGVEAPTGGGEGEPAAAAEQPDGAQAGADIRAGWPDSVVDEAPSAGAVAEETEPSGSEDRAPVLDPLPLAGAVAQSAGGAPTLGPDPTVLDSDGMGSGDGERPDRPSPVVQPPGVEAPIGGGEGEPAEAAEPLNRPGDMETGTDDLSERPDSVPDVPAVAGGDEAGETAEPVEVPEAAEVDAAGDADEPIAPTEVTDDAAAGLTERPISSSVADLLLDEALDAAGGQEPSLLPEPLVAAAASADPCGLGGECILVVTEAGGAFLQVGAFTKPDNAEAMVARLRALTDHSVDILEASSLDGSSYWRVRIGPVMLRETLLDLVGTLEEAGYDVANAPTPAAGSGRFAGTANQPLQAMVVLEDGERFLQVGAYSERATAETLAAELRHLTGREVGVAETGPTNDPLLYRVRIGPLEPDDALISSLVTQPEG